MIETIATAGMGLALVAALALVIRREDARLRRRARRYRQLEHEGIEEIVRDDPFPEQAVVEGGFLCEPSGRQADTQRVLKEELAGTRAHPQPGTKAIGPETRAHRKGGGMPALIDSSPACVVSREGPSRPTTPPTSSCRPTTRTARAS